MTIDLSSILAGLEAKITAMDSNTPLDDMILNLKSYQEAGGKLAAIYDSAGTLPAADSDYTGMMVYANNALYMFNGNRWDEADSDTVTDPISPYSYQGTVSGYVLGGIPVGPSASLPPVFDKFSLTSDGNATAVIDLSLTYPGGVYYGAGVPSRTHGYSIGGGAPDVQGPAPTTPNWGNLKFKYSFSVDEAPEQITSGELGTGYQFNAAHTEGNYAYTSGGSSPTAPAPTGVTDVLKFPFAVDTSDATDVGDLIQVRYGHTGHSSPENAYTAGSGPSNGAVTIDKFPFSSDANATSVGNILTPQSLHYRAAGISSTEYGYTAGGYPDTIARYKFSFASDGDAAASGNLSPPTAGRANNVGVESETYGYAAGGFNSPAYFNIIDKFPFSSDGTPSTDVGDLTDARYGSTSSSH